MAERSKQEIEAEIAAARARLASNIEGLITQVHPRAVVVRGVADAKGFAEQEAESMKARFVDEYGELRIDRVALLAAAVIGSIAFLAITRSLVRKK